MAFVHISIAAGDPTIKEAVLRVINRLWPPSHTFRISLKPGPGFTTRYIVGFYVLNRLTSEVRVRFVVSIQIYIKHSAYD